MSWTTKLKYFIKVILTPTCWLQNESYSEAWDELLLKLMEEHKFIHINQYVAKIGNVTVWIENHPYASFTFFNIVKCRPSRRTILMAHKKLMQDFIEASANGNN